MSDTRKRLRAVVLERLESLELAGVQQLPQARRRPQTAAEARLADAMPVAACAVVCAMLSDSPAQIEELVREESIVARKVTATANIAAADTTTSCKTPSSGWSRAGGALFEPEVESNVRASDATSLEILRQEVAPCTRCQELATTRTQTVFGVGNPKSRLCFMGEAPGADEDRLGEPFVGRAGQLLDKIIEACQLKREEIYILNMLKCRPPGNRNPLPDELANCRPFLERQLELIEPEFICCLGAVSSQNLLGVTTPIGKLRGKLHKYRGAKVVCTFHPAYLLRNPAAKKDCWEDMKFLMREMGVEL
jgi:DNA polymerase